MKKVLCVLFVALLAGCQNLTPATPVYKAANSQRLTTVEPMLNTYGTDHPASAQNVKDILASWHKEVDAQKAATTAPATPAK